MIIEVKNGKDLESLKRRLIASGYDIKVVDDNLVFALPNPRSAKTGKMHRPLSFPGSGKSR